MPAPVADEQILRGSSATLSARFRGQDGDLADPVGTVTVSVTAADGSEVLAAGSATTTPSGLIGVRQRALTPAQTSNVGLLTATWTDAGDLSARTSLVEVVGGYYASTFDIRSADPVLDDPVRYPTAKITAARRTVESEFEDVCGVAFVPRYRRAWLSGTGTDTVVLPDTMLRSVRSVRVYSDATTYTSWTAEELAEVRPHAAGLAVRTDGDVWTAGTENIVVEYEHGHDRPPQDVLDAFYTRIRDVLNRSNRGVPDRTSTYSSQEGGTFSLIVPGQRGSITGIPDVDVVLMRYKLKVPGVA